MAPTTRAGAKRLRGETPSVGKASAKRKSQSKNGSKPTGSFKSAGEVEYHFPFLKLSPELRNRIYDFAAEEFDDNHRFAPEVRLCTQAKPYATRTWKYFALTQACKQIRAEYRPLWIRECSVRLPIQQLGQFVDTFLPNVADLKYAPKLLQITWDHGTSNMVSRDITPLLRLRAHVPSFRCDFVPYMVASGMTQDEDICDYCMGMFHLEEHGLEPNDNMWDACTCPDPDWGPEEWEEYQYVKIAYTDSVRNFAHNTTEAWLDDIREGKMSVHCSFVNSTNHVMFRILYAPQLCKDTSDSKSAWELLNKWSLFDLRWQHRIDFVLAYEDKQKSTDSGYEMTNSVVHEVRFTKT